MMKILNGRDLHFAQRPATQFSKNRSADRGSRFFVPRGDRITTRTWSGAIPNGSGRKKLGPERTQLGRQRIQEVLKAP
jgi:hypothetical protein